ncbi:MAG TPA: SUKH-4 family immunity protein [Thermoanaerobaculia bacterium]|nr:SUKH-4 family immunity protein [Thermoanaerobaculia bacterium]
MTAPEILNEIAGYWCNVNVPCEKTTVSGGLAGSDLAELWQFVGMPAQDWWGFSFEYPVDPGPEQTDVVLGSFGDWRLFWRLTDGSCFEMNMQGTKNFANSSVGAFAQMLTLWDSAYRRIQKECPGDSGDDWAHGDTIVSEMKKAMRQVDPQAFASEKSFWPSLIFELAE